MIDRAGFFGEVRNAFGALSRRQVDGFLALLDCCEADLELRPQQIAYMLATAWHETARTMQPIKEYGSPAYLESRYDPVKGSSEERRARARRMGNTRLGDGIKFAGRGYVQLTWRSNYKKLGALLGVDLENNPDLALDQNVAAAILRIGMKTGVFTGRKLSDYINIRHVDYVNARRVVNGTDKAGVIAEYACIFEKALEWHS